MILSLMRLKSQINRSKDITNRTSDTVKEQIDEEKAIGRKFRQNVEVPGHFLSTCQNERNRVTSFVRAGLEEARKSIEDRGTHARINRRGTGKEAIRSVAESFSGSGIEAAWAKN